MVTPAEALIQKTFRRIHAEETATDRLYNSRLISASPHTAIRLTASRLGVSPRRVAEVNRVPREHR